MSDSLWKVFIALAPTVGVLFIFYQVMKGVLEGDRRERIAHAQWEREHDAAAEKGIPMNSPSEKSVPGNGAVAGGEPKH